MNRTSPRAMGDRVISTVVHAMVDKVGDGSLQQTLDLVGRGTQGLSDIEHMYPFGFRAYPQDKTSDEDAKNGAPKGGPEVSMISLGGNQSTSIALPAIDRRFGPKNLAAGEIVNHDAHNQFTHYGKDFLKSESPKKIIHQVASAQSSGDDQSGGDQSGGSTQSGQSAQQNSGRADLTAKKTVHASVTMDKDGTYTVNAEGDATITAKTITLKCGNCSLKITSDGFAFSGGKITHDGKDIGKDHIHGGVMSGGSNTTGPAN